MAKTVMIVDDSASLRQVVAISLTQAGYDVVQAEDGKHALSMLDGRKLHLVVSDVNMPNMDGLSFLKKMKELPSYKFTPVIMLTTEAGEAKKQAGREFGAKAWMTKPFQPAQLLGAVAKLVLP